MGKIVVSEFLSVDGVMETPEDWHFPYASEDVQAYVTDDINRCDATLYGRVTYDIFSQYWPNQQNNEFGFADHLNRVPKYVVSTTLESADWQNTTILRDIDAVKAMKESVDGIISITGSRTLIHALMKANLVDRLQLLVDPIVLGEGQRLFEDGMAQFNLKFVELKQFQSGAILLTYETVS